MEAFFKLLKEIVDIDEIAHTIEKNLAVYGNDVKAIGNEGNVIQINHKNRGNDENESNES